MNYFNLWYDRLLSGSSINLDQTLSASGQCHRNAEPNRWIAAVEISVSPSETFEVEDKLTQEVRKLLNEAGCYDPIIFGVLDIMLIQPVLPIRWFKLTVLNAEIHPIHSNATAFRLAARDATMRILDQLFGR